MREEAEEAVQAVDNEDMENLCEELGDVLFQVMLNSQIAKEKGLFSVDECGEHGFVLLDIKDNKLVGNEFISVSYRNLYEEDVDISECMNSVEMAEKVREVLYKKDYASASLIKVVLTGQIDINAEKNLTYITENFKNDYYYFKLYDHTSIKVDYSSYQYDKSLKGEFVRLVESDDTLDDITKASIIKIGIDALSGEEFI